MILDLGQFPPISGMVRITADYSNAVLVAILPFVSDVAERLNLPVPHPVTAAQVLDCSIPPSGKPEAQVILRGGWCFAFKQGYVQTIQSPHCYSVLQNPDDIPLFYGEVRMTKPEAVRLARDTLKKLGIPLESVFAEQDPEVSGPQTIGTNTVPHYQVVWHHPRGGRSVSMEINGNLKRVERICLRNESLERPPPKVSVTPQRGPSSPAWPQVNPEYARQLVPVVLHAIEEYAQKLALPVPKPLTTNEVERFRVRDNGGWPHCEIHLTNGWRFVYRHAMVNGYEAPDTLLFGRDRGPILAHDFAGKWRMSEGQAIELVRKTLTILAYPTNLIHLEVEPQIHKPAVPGITRYAFFWYYTPTEGEEPQSTVWAEVDAGTRKLKCLYYDDRHYWGQRPAIDAPILLPTLPTAEEPPRKPSKITPAREAPHQRLDHPVPLPR